MSSPSSLLDNADTALLNTWMSRIVLRLAGPEDRPAVEALAALESTARLTEPVLLLEEDGHLRAARSLHDGVMVSDPFAATAHLCRVLSAHAARPERRGRLREFLSRQVLLWERLGGSWDTSGGDALSALRRARPIID